MMTVVVPVSWPAKMVIVAPLDSVTVRLVTGAWVMLAV